MKLSSLWLWTRPEASAALQSRDLATIMRTYRRLNGLSQERLAVILGYDKTYISMIENRRRSIVDVGTLRNIAHRLCIPVHVLGVTEADDATTRAMVQFAESVISLADTARRNGNAVAAIDELWPLVARLEARAAEGLIERDSLRLLGRGRLSLGLALGAVLPEEQLSTAAKWTGQALVVASHLDDQSFLAEVLTMHGNELRKAGRVNAALARADRALSLSRTAKARISALAILARAAGETAQSELFDYYLSKYEMQLGAGDQDEMLGSPFTFREIKLRGLVATGRASLAAKFMQHESTTAAAPQWNIIEQVTVGEVLFSNGEQAAAEANFLRALGGAEKYRLPHQVQRIVRISGRYRSEMVANEAERILAHLASRLDLPQ